MAKSLRIALLEAATEKPQRTRDVIHKALAATGWEKTDEGWKHPTKTGRTPDATASAEIVRLTRAGLLAKPEVGMVARLRSERKRIKEIIEGRQEGGDAE